MSEQKEPIRVLHIVGRMDRGGIETMIMNIYRNIDRSKVQFDFLAHYGREAVYNDEIRRLGGKIYEMPALKDETHVYYWRIFEYIAALHKFFREHKEYKIIHGHMTNTAAIYMPIAKKYGVKCLIAHSHNSRGKEGLSGLITNLLQRPIFKSATDWFACSSVAADWFYPREAIESGKVKIIPNAVDAKKFRFDPIKRSDMKKNLGVTGNVVIGCVARFRKQKNHIFLMDVMRDIVKKEPNAVLLCAGDGPCEKEVCEKAVAYGIEKHVKLLGMRTDIPDILQAMDVLVMPSKYEGLPVAGIEAQASGLRIIASTGVTREMNILNMVEYIPLDAPIEEWSEKILNSAMQKREDTYEKLKDAGYDINITAPWLQDFYLEKQGKR